MEKDPAKRKTSQSSRVENQRNPTSLRRERKMHSNRIAKTENHRK
jgi:hypothetical protein